MNRLLLSLLTVAALMVVAFAVAGRWYWGQNGQPEARADAPQVLQLQSPEGTNFHFLPMLDEGQDRIAISTAWPHRWPHDPDLNPAVAYVAKEAILSSGTDTMEPLDVLETFNDFDAVGYIWIDADFVRGYLAFPSEHKETIIPLVAKIVGAPQLDGQWIARLKADLEAGEAQARLESATALWQAARLAILGDQPLNNFLSLLEPNAIEQVTAADVRTWYDANLNDTPLVITVVGNTSEADAGNMVDTLLAQLAPGRPYEAPATKADFQPRTVLFHDPDAPTTTMALLGQLPPIQDRTDIYDLLGLSVLGHSDGPLFETVRTNLGASYGLQPFYANYDQATRLMFITGEVETAKLAEAIELSLDAYETFRTAPDLSALEAVRGTIVDDLRDNLRDPTVVANVIVDLLVSGQDPDRAVDFATFVNGIGEEDLRIHLSETYPAADDLMVFAVSADADALPGACIITEVVQVVDC